MTVTNVADVTTKFLFGIRECTVDSDVGTGDFSFVLRIFHARGNAHVRSCASSGMDYENIPYNDSTGI